MPRRVAHGRASSGALGINDRCPADSLTMPPHLTKAHQALDRAIDRLYRNKPLESDTERLELLFERYRELTEESG